MKLLMKMSFLFLCTKFLAFGDVQINQTPDVNVVYPSSNLPFQIKIEQTNLQLPNGVHSVVYARHNGKLLLLAGRTNG